MKCRPAPVLKLCQSPLPGHCCNSGIIRGTSPRCFPYTTVCQLTHQLQAILRGTRFGTWSAERHWEADPTTAGRGHFQMHQVTPANRWDFPTPHPWPHKFYSTSVTNELVRTLGLSDKTPPGLPGLKPSSNSVLPVAWITRPATDLRHVLVYCVQYLLLLSFRLVALMLSNFRVAFKVIGSMYILC